MKKYAYEKQYGQLTRLAYAVEIQLQGVTTTRAKSTQETIVKESETLRENRELVLKYAQDTDGEMSTKSQQRAKLNQVLMMVRYGARAFKWNSAFAFANPKTIGIPECFDLVNVLADYGPHAQWLAEEIRTLCVALKSNEGQSVGAEALLKQAQTRFVSQALHLESAIRSGNGELVAAGFEPVRLKAALRAPRVEKATTPPPANNTLQFIPPQPSVALAPRASQPMA